MDSDQIIDAVLNFMVNRAETYRFRIDEHDLHFYLPHVIQHANGEAILYQMVHEDLITSDGPGFFATDKAIHILLNGGYLKYRNDLRLTGDETELHEPERYKTIQAQIDALNAEPDPFNFTRLLIGLIILGLLLLLYIVFFK